LIYAFHASLSAITKNQPSLEERFRLHKEASSKIKKAVTDLGLKLVSIQPVHFEVNMFDLPWLGS
jgi:alanine-glyoxylate transaminase/serine-glyoxylate transaminase/serine-pyruvate transaminase